MNKEVGYILRGFLLMLVILAGLGFVHLLTSSDHRQQVEDSPRVYITNSDNAEEPPVYNARGKALFEENCGACHRIRWTDNNFNLPYIEDKIKDKQLLRGWIRNSDSILKTGNRYFNKLYENWGKAPMPPFPQLSDEDIDDILEYLWRHRK